MARAECLQCGLHFQDEDDYWEESHLKYCDGNPDQDELDPEEEEDNDDK